MPEFAGEIEIVTEGTEGAKIQLPRSVRIYIDGEEFPWYTEKGVTLKQERGEVPSVMITIPAGQVKWTHRTDS